MGSDGSTRERVGAGIERLEERYGSFPVNQTTLDVASADYETARERADDGLIDVYVRVRNDDGEVLHVRDDGDLAIPRCVSDPDEPISISVARTIEAEANVGAAVEDIVRATIAGIHEEDDPEASTVYRLLVLVDATVESGSLDGAVWQPDDAALPEYV